MTSTQASHEGETRAGGGLSKLALLGGQLLLIYLLQGQLAQGLVSKPEFIYLTVLPGLVWPLVVAWLFSAWQARRHPGSSAAAGWVTAVPLGFNLVAAGWLSSGLLLPVFRQGVAQGIAVENAGNLAWSAAVACTLLVGLLQLILAPLAHRLVASLSLSVCQTLGAALAGTLVLALLPWLQQHPLLSLSGLLPLLAFGLVGLPRPFGLSLGWLLLGAGLCAQLASSTPFELPDLAGMLLPNWRVGWIEGGLQYLWLQPEFLSGAIPLLLVALVRDLVLLRECQSQPNPPSVRSTMLGLGCLNVLGACLGCGLPLGVLPGFVGFRRWGGGQFYSQASGLLLATLGLAGIFGAAFRWIPLPTLGVVLAVQLLVSALASLNRLPHPHGALLLAAWLPFWNSSGESPALLVGLVWGGLAVTAQAGRWDQAARVALLGCILAYTGILHHNLWQPDFDPVAGTYLAAAVLMRIRHVMSSVPPKERELPPPAGPEPPDDSTGSPGTLAFGIPADSRSAEGAGSSLGG